MVDRYDICIIGGGPAGHSAALYTSRALLNTVLFEGLDTPGGQLTQTSEVENFLGFPEGIQGYDLCQKFKKQSERWGTKIISEYVERISKDDEDSKEYKVYYDDMNKYIITKSIIICSGSVSKKLYFEGSELFWNNGITSCAICHGALPIFRNKPLFVVGGGDTAMEEALYLSKYSSQVNIIHRGDYFRASRIMQERVFTNSRINIIWNTEVIGAYGKDIEDIENMENYDKFLDSIKVKNVKTGKETIYKANGLFYAIGHDPCVFFLKNSNVPIALDKDDYILTESNSSQTNIDGIFAAGDVLSSEKKFKQAIVAAGSGCKAALEAVEYLK
jgi:thioredoxin reductase (NADPH)